jgi:hypothetical protein
MLLALSILVMLLTLFGVLLMAVSVGQYVMLIVIAGSSVNSFAIALFTQIGVSTLIVIVGLSAAMIVSAIRNQPPHR